MLKQLDILLTDLHSIDVRYLRSDESHGLSPDVVGPKHVKHRTNPYNLSVFKSYSWAAMTLALLRRAGPGSWPSYLISWSSVPWKWAYWTLSSSERSEHYHQAIKKYLNVHLEVRRKLWDDLHIKVVWCSFFSGLGKLPELVIMVLGTYQGGDHRECPE